MSCTGLLRGHCPRSKAVKLKVQIWPIRLRACKILRPQPSAQRSVAWNQTERFSDCKTKVESAVAGISVVVSIALHLDHRALRAGGPALDFALCNAAGIRV